MRSSTLHELFNQFFRDPTERNYLRARQRILKTRHFDPYCAVVYQAIDRFAQDDFQSVVELCEKMLPLWRLCPRIHFLSGVAWDQLGERDKSEMHRNELSCCLEGIIATGEGSMTSPFVATYPSDAYDVLKALRLQPQGQRLIEMEESLLDVIHCGDFDCYFDVTELLSRRSLGQHTFASRSLAGLV